MSMRRRRYGAILLICGLAATATGSARAAPTFEPGFDRTGGDYASLAIPRPRPRLCQDACLRDDHCLAWTFVRPGILGPMAICWFKNPIPATRPSDCCVSGLK
jgi:hypothetical protein